MKTTHFLLLTLVTLATANTIPYTTNALASRNDPSSPSTHEVHTKREAHSNESDPATKHPDENDQTPPERRALITPDETSTTVPASHFFAKRDDLETQDPDCVDDDDSDDEDENKNQRRHDGEHDDEVDDDDASIVASMGAGTGTTQPPGLEKRKRKGKAKVTIGGKNKNKNKNKGKKNKCKNKQASGGVGGMGGLSWGVLVAGVVAAVVGVVA
ncbi:hypothetical protein VTJ49DRAFT_514 [Mycothermus thermophilus]|uniref:Uncharacterized protein n=1 Tax=Humicola insolens TaxID=85995 RepID=A0ABR3VFC6_HUMIN